MSLQMCRVCMVKGNNFNKLGTGKDSYAHKLNYCVPEIDLSLTDNPLICESCLPMLEKAFELRMKCLLTEEALKAYTEISDENPNLPKNGIKITNKQSNHTQNKLELNDVCLNVDETNCINKDMDILRSLKLMAVKPDKIAHVKREINEEIDIKMECMNENETDKNDESEYVPMEFCNENINTRLRSSIRKPLENKDKEKSTEHVIKCLKCNRLFKSKGHLKQHMRSHNKFKCMLCSTWFDSQNNLDKHFQGHEQINDLVNERCSVCFKLYMNREELQSHEKAHVFCDICDVCLENQEQLAFHMILHANVEDNSLFHCDICGQYFIKEIYKMMHPCMIPQDAQNNLLKSKGENASFPCGYCGKVFPTMRRFNIHKASHLNVSYTCKICSKVYKDTISLMLHERSHTNPTECIHNCSMCNTNFKTKALLKSHNYLIHGENYLKCSVCDKEFAVKQRLQIHMRVHTGEKPYQCDLCGKCFQIKGSLQVHKKIHTNEKPFQCHNCGKRFITKGNLLVHSRVHTGEKPFTCPVCARRFTLKNTMIIHIRNKHKNEMNEMDFMEYDRTFHDQLYEKFEAVYSEGSHDQTQVDNLDALNVLVDDEIVSIEENVTESPKQNCVDTIDLIQDPVEII